MRTLVTHPVKNSYRSSGRKPVFFGPYAITPGMDSISAHQRPSSSCPSAIGIDSDKGVSIDGALPSDIIVSGALPTANTTCPYSQLAHGPGSAFEEVWPYWVPGSRYGDPDGVVLLPPWLGSSRLAEPVRSARLGFREHRW